MSEGSKKLSIAIEIDREEMMALADKIGGKTGSWEERCGRLARALGCGFSRAKALMYGEARRIDSHEIAEARRIAAAVEERAEKARFNAEMLELHARLARLEALLAVQDEDFHRPTREVVRGQMGGVR